MSNTYNIIDAFEKPIQVGSLVRLAYQRNDRHLLKIPRLGEEFNENLRHTGSIGLVIEIDRNATGGPTLKLIEAGIPGTALVYASRTNVISP